MTTDTYTEIRTACRDHGVIFMLNAAGWFWSVQHIEQPNGPHASLKIAFKNWDTTAPKLIMVDPEK